MQNERLVFGVRGFLRVERLRQRLVELPGGLAPAHAVFPCPRAQQLLAHFEGVDVVDVFWHHVLEVPQQSFQHRDVVGLELGQNGTDLFENIAHRIVDPDAFFALLCDFLSVFFSLHLVFEVFQQREDSFWVHLRDRLRQRTPVQIQVIDLLQEANFDRQNLHICLRDVEDLQVPAVGQRDREELERIVVQEELLDQRRLPSAL